MVDLVRLQKPLRLRTSALNGVPAPATLCGYSTT